MEGNPSSPSRCVGFDSESLLEAGMVNETSVGVAVGGSLDNVSSANNSSGSNSMRDEEEMMTKLMSSVRSQDQKSKEGTNLVQSPVMSASPKQTYSRRKSHQKESCFSATSLQASKSSGIAEFSQEKCVPQEPAVSFHGIATPNPVKELKHIENATTVSRFESQVITSLERTRFKEIIEKSGGEEQYLRCSYTEKSVYMIWQTDVGFEVATGV